MRIRSSACSPARRASGQCGRTNAPRRRAARGEMDLQLVYKPGPDALLDHFRAARDPDVLAVRGIPRLLQDALDAVGDEREGRTSLPNPGFPPMVGEDKHRRAEWWGVRPAHLPLVEHAPAHHVGPHAGVRLLDEFLVCVVVCVGLTASEALALAPGFEVVDPPVYSRAPVAQVVVGPGVRPGDEAV